MIVRMWGSSWSVVVAGPPLLGCGDMLHGGGRRRLLTVGRVRMCNR